MALFERLIEDLLQTEAFKDYKFRKTDSSLIYKFNGGIRKVKLDHWTEYGYCSVRPTIGFHYDIVVKWFEKFSTLTLRDQRNNPLYFTCPYEYGWKGNANILGDIFDIKCDGSDYDETSRMLIHAVTETVKLVFERFKTLDDYYKLEIQPYLTLEKDTPMGGANWFFEGLTVCRIVSPDNYEKLKSIFMERAEWMMFEWKYAPERNMERYYYRLDEIFSYLESLDFDAMQKNPTKVILR